MSAAGSSYCVETCAELGSSVWHRGTGCAVDTSGVGAAVDRAADGDVILWEAGTNLVQTWSVAGMIVNKAITLECADVVSMCTIDAQASNSDRRRVLQDNHGTDESSNYIGIKFTGGYTVSERRKKFRYTLQ